MTTLVRIDALEYLVLNTGVSLSSFLNKRRKTKEAILSSLSERSGFDFFRDERTFSSDMISITSRHIEQLFHDVNYFDYTGEDVLDGLLDYLPNSSNLNSNDFKLSRARSNPGIFLKALANYKQAETVKLTGAETKTERINRAQIATVEMSEYFAFDLFETFLRSGASIKAFSAAYYVDNTQNRTKTALASSLQKKINKQERQLNYWDERRSKVNKIRRLLPEGRNSHKLFLLNAIEVYKIEIRQFLLTQCTNDELQQELTNRK